MKTYSISPEHLLKIFLGQPDKLDIDDTGLVLLAANKNDQPNLPSEMAGGIVYLENHQPTLVSLVHPFAVPEQAGVFETDDHLKHQNIDRFR